MTLTLELAPEVEARLRTNAALHGKDVAEYLITLAENDTSLDLTEFSDMADFEESVAGIHGGLADLDAGCTISFEEMFTELKVRAEERHRQQEVIKPA